MADDAPPPSLKIILIGSGTTGKTSALSAYVKGVFPTEHCPTVFDNDEKDIMVDGSPVRLMLWDTAGQEDFKRLRPLSYPGADAFLVCFDVANPASIANIVSLWAPEVKHYGEGAPMVLVANKIDLRTDADTLARLKTTGEEPYTTDQGLRLADEIGAIAYMETSAKSRIGLDELFDKTARCVLERRKQATKPRRRCAIL